MSDWISVNDKLPAESGDYICARNMFKSSDIVAFCLGDDDCDNARWLDSDRGALFYSATKERREKMKNYGVVTHWMKLPEPPK